MCRVESFRQKMAALIFVASLLACAPLTNVKPTVETTLSVSLDNALLHKATLRYAKNQDWTITTSEEGLGWVEAISKVDDSDGMRTRERWVISTRTGEIGIQLYLEFFSQGTWQSLDLVCHGYSYFRETQHLAAIAEGARAQSVATLPPSFTSHQGAR